jgi:hypothetical protein
MISMLFFSSFSSLKILSEEVILQRIRGEGKRMILGSRSKPSRCHFFGTASKGVAVCKAVAQNELLI